MGNGGSTDILVVGNYACLGRKPIERYFQEREIPLGQIYTNDNIKIYNLYYKGMELRIFSSSTIPSASRLKELGIDDIAVILMYDSNRSYLRKSTEDVKTLFSFNELVSKFSKKSLDIRICVGDYKLSHVPQTESEVPDLEVFYPIDCNYVFKETELSLYFCNAMDSILE
jgi:hypothetical protein